MALLTFKAGKCSLDTSSSPPKAQPESTPGYLYLYNGEDDLLHLAWRPRTSAFDEPEIDLIMFPGDGSFVPYTSSDGGANSENLRSPTNGRVFVLKFSSSSSRHLFWLQSKSQAPDGSANWFSPRDQKIGQIVDSLLSGENLDLDYELEELRNMGSDRDDDDDPMEDVEGHGQGSARPRHGSGGAGPDATGGDIREEGEEAREGGADGGRAASSGQPVDTSALVQNFLSSLGPRGGAQATEKRFTTLPDPLPSAVTIPTIDKASHTLLDALLSALPSTLLAIETEAELEDDADPTSDEVQAVIMSLGQDQKRSILRRVLRSPQLHQSLASLTAALRDGGLPTVGDALKVDVPNGGWITRGSVAVTGEAAVRAFVDGIKSTVEKEESSEENMDVD